MDVNAKCYYDAAAQLPSEFSCALLRLPETLAVGVTEIRLRSGRPVVLTTADKLYFIRTDGKPELEQSPYTLKTSHSDIDACFHAVCAYSVHTFENCIAQGFVPLSGGHRVGVCGTAVYTQGNHFNVKNITSLNIRIARIHLKQCSPELTQLLQKEGSMLLVGSPGSGKTTLLRAALSVLSDKEQKIAVVDERFEIAPVEATGFVADLPVNCDIMSGYPKHIGMLHALRSMGPDVIVCDEIGSMEDVYAVESIANAGVRLIAAVHANSIKAMQKRPQTRALLATGAFRWIVLLKGSAAPGAVEEVCDVCDCD